jgi:signal transduction histidine kinase
MAGLDQKLLRWIASKSVFSLLLITTIVSTVLLSFVLILSLQRIADEHPRRYLARTLFHEIVNQASLPGDPAISVDGVKLVTMTAAQARASEYADLFDAAMSDSDSIAVERFGNRYAAGFFDGKVFTVLPQFGEPISTFALILVGLVVLSICLVVLGIYFLMRRLTRPFGILSTGIARIEDGDLDYQIPLRGTYGEFRSFAISFNNMVAELQRIHEARRHMLLALPHELLTPLSRLKVRKELVNDEELRQKIGKDISVVEEILSSILAAEKRHSNEDATELVEILPYAQEQIAQQVDEGHPIRITNETGYDLAFFDPFAVGILLKNFVSNAVRYGNGQQISVRFVRAPDEPSAMQMIVEDRGIGIAANQIPYLTEPFWRVDESRGRASGGYGLGLYLCRTIVEGLGGDIDIQSELGVGTQISVTIPNAICETIEGMGK